jgi:hypothetical protein
MHDAPSKRRNSLSNCQNPIFKKIGILSDIGLLTPSLIKSGQPTHEVEPTKTFRNI